jgi:hypothetical protein
MNRSLQAMLTIVAVVIATMGLAATAGGAPPERVEMCHFDETAGEYILLSLPGIGGAVDAHLRHGDAEPGDAVPQDPSSIFGDDCEAEVVDSDGDGVPDGDDQCPGFDDTIDVDADGIPDGCDDLIDSDGDGVADADDQCPGYDDAADSDGDGIPDGCDLGTGDVQVTLSWVGEADMDLHVIEPSTEHIYWGNQTSATGGQLDVDAIPGCGSSSTAMHFENVFWPTGAAPDGDYETYVDAFSTCGGAVPEWTLTVKVDGVIVLQATDAVDMAAGPSILVPTTPPYEFTNG